MALKLIAEIGLNTAALHRGLNSVKNTIAGAFSIGAISSLAHKTIEFAKNIDILADRLGMSTDYLQEMEFVMKQNGGTVDSLTTAFERMGAARVKALQGNERAQKAFGLFGIGRQQLETANSQKLMDTIAARFKELGNNDQLKTAFREIGGRGAGVLVPAFISGLEEQRARADKMSADTIANLREVAIQYEELGHTIMIEFAPALSYATEKLHDLGVGLRLFFGWLIGKADHLNRTTGGYLSAVNLAESGASLEEITKARESADPGAEDQTKAITDAIMKDSEEWRKKREERLAALRASRVASRDYSGITPEDKGATKLRSADSLVSVGNFLGQSGAKSMIEEIAKKQLNALERSNDLLQQIADRDSLGIP